MTPEQLATIRAYVEAATVGPWEKLCLFGSSDLPVAIIGNDSEGKRLELSEESTFTVADIEFIARIRTDAVALLDEVERLRAALEQFDGSCWNLHPAAIEVARKALEGE